MVLDLCAVKFDGASSAAAGEEFHFDIDLGDGPLRVTVKNGVMRHGRRTHAPSVATISTTPPTLALVANQLATLDDTLADGSIRLDGDRTAFERFLARLEQFELF